MIWVVGPAKVRSDSFGSNELMAEGDFSPGKHVVKQSMRLSPNPIKHTQVGITSNKLRNDATMLIIVRGSNIPRGAPSIQTRCNTVSAQKQRRITQEAVGVFWMANE